VKPIVNIICYLKIKCEANSWRITVKRGPDMLQLDTDTLLFLATVILCMGFFLGSAMHGVLGEEGLGPYGNMAAIVAGFVGGVYAMKYFGMNIKDLSYAAMGGLVGAYSFLLALVLSKNIMHRLGY
jgi:hypothetical protein